MESHAILMAEVMDDAVSIIGNGIFERWRSCMDGISLFFVFILEAERRHPTARKSSGPIAIASQIVQ